MRRSNHALTLLLVLSLAPAPWAIASDLGTEPTRSVTIALGNTDSARKTIHAPRDSDRIRVIVEFRLAPLARSATTARLVAEHVDLFTRLRGDLARIDSASLDAKALPSTIEQEYSRVFSGAAVSIERSSLDALRHLSYVRRATLDYEVRALVEPGVALVGADRVWSSFSTRGAGTTVAVIDTGIDYTHPALGGGFGPAFKVIGGWDFVNDDADPIDDNGHGTHVAGIVAANHPDLLGVAPEATLRAYKVLDANGIGSATDIIAAIERCVDPNGDFDFSDHVDVANASVGGAPQLDDPQSEAVNNAVAAGVVFCVAAGNAGTWQSISSPGTAEDAITVGAVDAHDALATFSSRGPAPFDYSLKPDVAAPGVEVRSAAIGGGIVSHSGTSMATPHVAGVAALLRAIHPSWTASQIKSALTTTAAPVEGSVMAAGAGRVDALRAASIGTTIEPTSITFDRVDSSAPAWSSRRVLTVRNASSESRTYTIGSAGQKPGLTLSASLTAFSLAPGAAREIEIQANVDNSLLPFPDDGSLTHGGFMIVDDGLVPARVAFALVKGIRVRVDYSGSETVTGFITPEAGESSFLPEIAEKRFETLVSPGTYGVNLVVLRGDPQPNAIIALESLPITADREFAVSYATAAHTLSFTAYDEHGIRFGLPPGPLVGCNEERVVWMPGDPAPMVSFLLGTTADLRTSTLSSRYTVLGNELCHDESGSKLYSMQYAPIHGVSSDAQRSAGGVQLFAQRMELRFPPPHDVLRELNFTNRLHLNGIPTAFQWSTSLYLPGSNRRWVGTLYLGATLDSEFQYFPAVRGISKGSEGTGFVNSSHLHRVANGVSCFNSPEPSPTAYTAKDGEPLVLGAGSVVPHLTYIGAANTIAVVELLGHLDERRGAANATISLYAENGALIAEGNNQIAIADVLAHPRLEFEAETHEVYGRPATTHFTGTFGASEQDPVPPTLTSLVLFDESGARAVDRVRRGTAARIEFSAIDTGEEPASVRLRFRLNGSIDWTEVSTHAKARDYPGFEPGREPRGTIYEASLGALAARAGIYDLELVVTDRAGNVAITLISPAIAVVDGRSRPVRP